MRLPSKLLTASTVVAVLSLACCRAAGEGPDPRPTTAPPVGITGTDGEVSPSNRTCVNLNTATAAELAALPVIGEVLAARIIEYRERHGAFRRPQDIIIVDGISERRFRKLKERLCV